MARYNKHIAFFLLLLFSFMQASELHVFDVDHDDDHENCILCHISSEKQESTYYLLNPTVTIPEFIPVFVDTTNEIAVDSSYFLTTIISFQNKAPPTPASIV